MDRRLDRIEEKIDSTHKEVLEIKLGYIEHERRSLANEQAVQLLATQVKPVYEVLKQVKLMYRIIIALGALAAVCVSALELFKLLQ